jgi:poly-gamma-glutamate capsule biosynthesis protein CapA/YwtB (metallophosphatase superfamily)
MKPITYLTGALAVAAALSAPSAGAGKPDPAGKTYTIFAGGDVNLGRWVPQAIQENGAKSALEDVADIISPADIAVVNIECVVSSRGHFWDKGERRPFLYRAPPTTIDVLTEAGIDVAIAANNHSMDFGPDALVEEIELLTAAGIAPVGIGTNLEEASRPVYVRAGDLIVAFIGLETEFPKFAATEDSPGTFHAKVVAPAVEALRAPIAEAREHADLIVFSPHWGDNWTERPTEELKETAHALVDLGVDAVIGHSAHHIHGVEIYKGKPIIYDMGSLFFDTVGQGRLRYSAGYVLEFGANGFSKVTMHPLILKPNRTEYADGAAWEKIKGLLTSLSAEFDPKVPLAVEGKTLVLRLPPGDGPKPRKSDPEKVHVSNTTRRLPDAYRARKTEDVVLDAPPEWAADFADVNLDNGVVVLGARSSDAVRPKLAFMAEVALAVPGPLDGGGWIAVLKGSVRGGEESFTWSHPIADGGWVPAVWEKGQIVVDRTLVRAALKEEGVYDLYWRLENHTTRKKARPIDARQGDGDGFVRIGEIEVKKKGIPDGPAGVAWDGWLPKSKEFDREKFEEAMEESAVLPPEAIAGIAGGAVLVLAVGAFLVVRRRRRVSPR